MVNVGVETLISPAFPVLEAVLNNPLGRLPLPEIEIDSPTVAATLPPCPEPLVLLTTCEPPARLRVFALSRMLPALPAPDVATDILPPSAMANVGVDTAICPAFPEPTENWPASVPPLSEVTVPPFWTLT